MILMMIYEFLLEALPCLHIKHLCAIESGARVKNERETLDVYDSKGDFVL